MNPYVPLRERLAFGKKYRNLKRVLLLVCLFLVVFSFSINAESPINVYSSVESVDFIVGESKSVSFTFENLFNQTVHNLTCSGDLFDDFVIPELSMEENVSRDVVFSSDSEYIGGMDFGCLFYFLEHIDHVPVVHSVNIGVDSFDPDSLEIRQGSTVRWNNSDSLSHDLFSSVFSLTVPVGGENSYVFNDVGVVDYQSLTVGFWGSVDVRNKTDVVSVHNSDYDLVKTININSHFADGLIDLELVDNNFSLDWNGSVEGILYVVNVGDVDVLNVSLKSSDWVSFNRNFFDLSVGERKYSYFTISPKIFSSNQTNMEYSVLVEAQGKNSGVISKSFSIFVNEADLSDEDFNMTEDELIGTISDLESRLLKLMKDLARFKQNGTETEIVYVDKEHNITVTSEDYLQMKRDIATMKADLELNKKRSEPAFAYIETDLPLLMQDVNKSAKISASAVAEVNDRLDKSDDFTAVVVIVIMFTSVCVAFLFFMKKRSRGKNLLWFLNKQDG